MQRQNNRGDQRQDWGVGWQKKKGGGGGLEGGGNQLQTGVCVFAVV